MPNTKRYLRISDACQHPEIPWTAEELRRRIHAAKPRYNSRGELILGSGDEQLLKAVIQETPGGSIWIDTKAIQDYLNDHRLRSTEALA